MSSPKCLTPDCTQKPVTFGNGLCMICWRVAKKSVEVGETTWEELEELGLARRPVEANSMFSRALMQKRKEAEDASPS